MKTLIIAFALAAFSGCATKTEYVDRVVEVKVPVKCSIPVVERPVYDGGSFKEFLRSLAEYDRKRDEAIKVCQ